MRVLKVIPLENGLKVKGTLHKNDPDVGKTHRFKSGPYVNGTRVSQRHSAVGLKGRRSYAGPFLRARKAKPLTTTISFDKAARRLHPLSFTFVVVIDVVVVVVVVVAPGAHSRLWS